MSALLFDHIHHILIFVRVSGLDSAGKSTMLSHLKRPRQYFPSPYTNTLVAEHEKEVAAKKPTASGGDADDKKSKKDKKAKKKDKKKKDGAEGKSTGEGDNDGTGSDDGNPESKDNGSGNDEGGALVPTPDLAPFSEVILPTCGVQARACLVVISFLLPCFESQFEVPVLLLSVDLTVLWCFRVKWLWVNGTE